MLQKLKKRDSNGFTIIEVMIVLAIAGLIMLIVFLAVPALERSSRNTQRKNDASNILSSINTYINNNGGTVPSSQATLTSALGEAKLGYYNSSNVYYGTGAVSTVSAPGTSGGAGTLTTDDVIVLSGFTCSSQTTAPAAGSARAVAIEYAVEESSGNGTLQCQSD